MYKGLGMNTRDNLNIASNFSKFPKLAAFLRLFVVYLGDYLSGNKHRHLYQKELNK